MGSQKSQTILVQVDASTQVDNHVITTCLDYIIEQNLLRSSRQRNVTPNLGVLATDQAPEAYSNICKNCSAPADSILNGYSQWYSIPDFQIDAQGDLFHISELELSHESIENVAKTLISRSNITVTEAGPYDKETVVIIDSLSSVSRFIDKPVVWVSVLLQKLCNQGGDISTILTVRCDEMDEYKSTIEGLKRVVDTHVRVWQVEGDSVQNDKIVMRVTRRRASGRVVIEEITGRYDIASGRLVDVETKTINSAREAKVQEEVNLEEHLSERGLTFRVSLSSKEREMRANAGLPYVHQDESIADQALELHPKHLQVDEDGEEDEFYEEEDEDVDEAVDGEELFSEDV